MGFMSKVKPVDMQGRGMFKTSNKDIRRMLKKKHVNFFTKKYKGIAMHFHLVRLEMVKKEAAMKHLFGGLTPLQAKKILDRPI